MYISHNSEYMIVTSTGYSKRNGTFSPRMAFVPSSYQTKNSTFSTLYYGLYVIVFETTLLRVPVTA